jgi:hypothetical protein
MLRGLIRAVLVTAVIALIVAGFAGLAKSAVTLAVGEPDLQAGVLIAVPVTATCSPFDPALTHFSSILSVSVEQANKKQIAFGSSFVGGTMSPTPILFPCDGTATTVSVNVLANPDGAPFRRGKAAFTISASASAGISCGPPFCFFNITSQNATMGPVILDMR